MKTLVLGHGKAYVPREIYNKLTENQKKTHLFFDMRCSPPEAGSWYLEEYISVDNDERIRPDILYDLRKRPWSFAETESFDRVIDTCGIAFIHFHSYDTWFLEQVKNVLKPGGFFYGFRGISFQKPI